MLNFDIEFEFCKSSKIQTSTDGDDLSVDLDRIKFRMKSFQSRKRNNNESNHQTSIEIRLIRISSSKCKQQIQKFSSRFKFLVLLIISIIANDWIACEFSVKAEFFSKSLKKSSTSIGAHQSSKSVLIWPDEIEDNALAKHEENGNFVYKQWMMASKVATSEEHSNDGLSQYQHSSASSIASASLFFWPQTEFDAKKSIYTDRNNQPIRISNSAMKKSQLFINNLREILNSLTKSILSLAILKIFSILQPYNYL